MAVHEFEIKVMNIALRGSDEWVVKMRSQIPYLDVAKREYFNNGFVTTFSYSSVFNTVEIPRGENGLPIDGYPPAINAMRRYPVEGLVSFLVWLGEDGMIDRLEAFSFIDDKWPQDPFEGFYDFQDDFGNIIESSL